MVEGPGCTRNGNTCRRAVSQRVTAVTGPQALQNLQTTIVGAKLIEVLTLGKELFLIFELDDPDQNSNVCLRIHFGMSGVTTLNGPALRYKQAPSLCITLNSATLRQRI